MYFVYLLECEDRSIYTGITTDLDRRFKEHISKTAAHYTRAHRARKILHSEKFETRSAASKREAEIKSWPREKKLKLVRTK